MTKQDNLEDAFIKAHKECYEEEDAFEDLYQNHKEHMKIYNEYMDIIDPDAKELTIEERIERHASELLLKYPL